ncbi:hypothetical protein BDV40DRAFT_275936 [Aspergillus tamarii]|uniref:Uncharacterized protein n=1 Tax=Aspergillus tamarii TaxID=41984 RepID=A0A5N6UIA9_ASPTM|nr:hypothetical protein BDV40DRAFT_275936 [Aspergillus tamarii]
MGSGESCEIVCPWFGRGALDIRVLFRFPFWECVMEFWRFIYVFFFSFSPFALGLFCCLLEIYLMHL